MLDLTQINDNWYQVKKISETVWCISDHGFDLMYLVKGKERAMLIDTGFGVGNLPDLCSKFASVEILSVLTHAHPDHCMGAGQFSNTYVAKEDVQLLQYLSDSNNRKAMADNFLDGNTEFTCDPATINNWANCKVNQITEIEDGHVFDLGERKIRVILTPGHTKGSLCLLDESEGRLFSGDTVLSCNHLLNLPESTDLQTFYQSLLYLQTFESGFNVIHPGHEKAPLGKEKLTELIHGVEDILSGKIKGIVDETTDGSPMKYSFGEHNWVMDRSVAK